MAKTFCLMVYKGDCSGRELNIWNSRNGVVPYIVTIEGEKFTHADFHRDDFRPHHEPKVGDYVFVDLTRERAVERRTKYVDLAWEEEDDMATRYASKEEAIRLLAEHDFVEHGGQSPDLAKVTVDWLAGFVAGRRNVFDLRFKLEALERFKTASSKTQGASDDDTVGKT